MPWNISYESKPCYRLIVYRMHFAELGVSTAQTFWLDETTTELLQLSLLKDQHSTLFKSQSPETLKCFQTGIRLVGNLWPRLPSSLDVRVRHNRTQLNVLLQHCYNQCIQFLANVLRYVRYMLSAVRLLSVCDVGAPYSGGWTFRQFFFIIR